jgi:hypothetical protein
MEEVGRAAGVGRNAADPRRGEDDDVRLRLIHPCLDLDLLPEIEPVAADGDEFAVLARQPAHQRRSHHAAMAGYPDSAPFDAERQFTHDGSLGAIALSRTRRALQIGFHHLRNELGKADAVAPKLTCTWLWAARL